MNNFYSNLATASQAMQGSVADAKKTQEQIGLLAKKPQQSEPGLW